MKASLCLWHLSLTVASRDNTQNRILWREFRLGHLKLVGLVLRGLDRDKCVYCKARKFPTREGSREKCLSVAVIATVRRNAEAWCEKPNDAKDKDRIRSQHFETHARHFVWAITVPPKSYFYFVLDALFSEFNLAYVHPGTDFSNTLVKPRSSHFEFKLILHGRKFPCPFASRRQRYPGQRRPMLPHLHGRIRHHSLRQRHHWTPRPTPLQPYCGFRVYLHLALHTRQQRKQNLPLVPPRPVWGPGLPKNRFFEVLQSAHENSQPAHEAFHEYMQTAGLEWESQRLRIGKMDSERDPRPRWDRPYALIQRRRGRARHPCDCRRKRVHGESCVGGREGSSDDRKLRWGRGRSD